MECPICNKALPKKLQEGINCHAKLTVLLDAVHDMIYNRQIVRIVYTADGDVVFLKVEGRYHGSGQRIQHIAACRCRICTNC
jgi:hypothetical protein